MLPMSATQLPTSGHCGSVTQDQPSYPSVNKSPVSCSSPRPQGFYHILNGPGNPRHTRCSSSHNHWLMTHVTKLHRSSVHPACTRPHSSLLVLALLLVVVLLQPVHKRLRRPAHRGAGARLQAQDLGRVRLSRPRRDDVVVRQVRVVQRLERQRRLLGARGRGGREEVLQRDELRQLRGLVLGVRPEHGRARLDRVRQLGARLQVAQQRLVHHAHLARHAARHGQALDRLHQRCHVCVLQQPAHTVHVCGGGLCRCLGSGLRLGLGARLLLGLLLRLALGALALLLRLRLDVALRHHGSRGGRQLLLRAPLGGLRRRIRHPHHAVVILRLVLALLLFLLLLGLTLRLILVLLLLVLLLLILVLILVLLFLLFLLLARRRLLRVAQPLLLRLLQLLLLLGHLVLRRVLEDEGVQLMARVHVRHKPARLALQVQEVLLDLDRRLGVAA
mmetsp:Transcript_23277/g.59489  ORF Transcript_23277/g.59489 Transcript_23277/m.59489 type:complete len:446 (+) Transcript_23277:164-1501(+)